MEKPSIPKGTRDFSPAEMVKREFIFDTIRSTFKKYGFAPIETPAMENLSTLLGKYGDEGDKLLFRILNSGDFLGSINKDIVKSTSAEISSQICEKGLRYDLTVPFARYVVQYRNDITFPFKRYQIQPVWRADRPQKGRYREFYQCDADVVGSNSLLNELELVQIIEEVFTQLNIKAIVKINNRKVLAGIAEIAGLPDRLTDITVAIDKLDKIGFDNVITELKEKGLTDDSLSKVTPFLKMNGSDAELISKLKPLLAGSSIGMLGIQEIETLFNYLSGSDVKINYEIDLTLARGLNYYTGSIFEVKAADVQIGSICGGGRYDDLTGIFGMPGVSGVGISFGADRIYDVMTQLDIFPADVSASTQVLFVNFGLDEEKYCLKLIRRLRECNISAEIYPDQSKLKKQMAYANSKAIPFVALIGAEEMTNNTIALKNMVSGEQTETTIETMIEILRCKK